MHQFCCLLLLLFISSQSLHDYVTIIPRARMGSESIAMRPNDCFSKIQLVSQKYRHKTTLASKTRFSRHCFGFQSQRFSLVAGYNI